MKHSGDKDHPNRLMVNLVETGDGSHTLYSGHFNEHYHSVHGAVQESRHVFIEAGLRKACESRNEINLLEIGFGTGLNALLSCIKALQDGLFINYYSIEPYPLPENVWTALNYGRVINFDKAGELYQKICSESWNEQAKIISGFNLTKSLGCFMELDITPGYYHLVYDDAFSPEVQPEMWTVDVFRKLFHGMAPGGILVTYCCKGIVKQALRSAGFRIERLPGPPGKREMIRAFKLS